LSGLPQVNGDRVVRALERAGFVLLRQAGSHAQMRIHKGKDLKPGTLGGILKGAGLTAEELKALL
jgi:predicted RNA binding protein YcfA (HicA-like mRNA interferase family)